MKKIILACLLTAFVFSISIAQKNNVSVSINDKEYKVQIKDDGQDLLLKLTGEVSFTDDEKGIEKLSPDADITYRKNGDKLEITPGDNGSPVYTINGSV